MVIRTIILENWKSYKGRISIPIRRFCAIIGPNGSGKSNLMDAISFVLGVNSSKLRGQKMTDLIYSPSAEIPSPSSASVELIFEKSSTSPSAVSVQILSFKRIVRSSGSSAYLFNNKKASWSDYNKQLENIGVLVQSRNFLVFQGDIEAVASKTPLQLTSLLEKISGSKGLAADFDNALKAKNEAENVLARHFDKRKVVLREKRQLSEQKHEADNYNKLLEKITAAKKKILLSEYADYKEEWESFERSNENGMNEKTLKNTLSRILDDITDFKRKRDGLFDKLENLKDRKLKLVDSNRMTKSEMSRNTAETTSVERAIKRIERSIKELIEKDSVRKERIEELSREMKKVQHQIDKLSSETESNGQDDHQHLQKLSKNKLKKLDQLKSEFEQAGKALKAQLCGLRNALAESNTATKEKQQKMTILKGREESISDAISKSQSEINRLKDEMTISKKRLESINESLLAKNKNSDLQRNQRRQIKAELKSKKMELENLQFDWRMTERDKKRLAIFNALKMSFPAEVKGFVADLIKPSHRRHRVAVAAALGNHNMEAIIVSTRADALKCIALLKERRLGTTTFIPLEGLRVHPLRTELRRRSPSVRLMADLVTHSREHRDLVLFLFGSTVCCDSLETARSVCFKEKTAQRIKAVTLDGTVIAKSGNMTGGTSLNIRNNTKRFDEAKARELETDIARLVEEVKESEITEGDDSVEREEKQEAINKTNLMKAEIATHEEIVSSRRKDLIEMKDEIKRIEKALENLCENRVKIEEEIESVEMKRNAIKEKIFRPFCLQNDIKDLNAVTGEHYDKRQRKQLELDGDYERLNAKLEFARSQSISNEIESKREELEKKRKALRSFQTVAESAIDTFTQTKKQISDLSKAIKEVEREFRTMNESVKENEKSVRGKREELIEVSKERSRRDSIRQVLENRKSDLIVRAELEDIDLEKEELPKRKEGRVKQIETKINSLKAKIAKLCPNLRSFEQLQKLEQKALKVNKEFHEVKKNCQERIRHFKDVETRRTALFNKAFSHVEREIGSVYRLLTRSEKFPLGGNAYLALENSDYQPFLHGTIFSAMPPAKRFREIESLSGGERSVAALALLFAIHSFRPAPFFVLDEVDAALDGSNVDRVVRFIKERTQREEMQCVVISLKDRFYHRADELVGVFKDQDENSSGVLTLDLERRFGKGEERLKEMDLGSAIAKRKGGEALNMSSFESEE